MTMPLAGWFKVRQKKAPYARSLRLCGEYLAAQAAGTASSQVPLVRAIGVFAAALDGPDADPFDVLAPGRRAGSGGG